jgi:hypothetical protein
MRPSPCVDNHKDCTTGVYTVWSEAVLGVSHHPWDDEAASRETTMANVGVATAGGSPANDHEPTWTIRSDLGFFAVVSPLGGSALWGWHRAAECMRKNQIASRQLQSACDLVFTER